MKVIEDTDHVDLDTWSLKIDKVVLEQEGDSKELQFKIDEETEIGNKMTIDLTQTLTKDTEFCLKIDYETDPTAKSLSWLTPEQTMEKTHPYLFSNSEPIYGRCIFPCQDTPSVKAPYTAKAKIKDPMTVLLSADIVKQETIDGFV